MRLMFFQWEYPPSGAGIGRYVQNMARALTMEGHQVFVVTSRVRGQPKEEPLGEEGRIYRVFDVAQTGLEPPARIAFEIARRHRVDVIETPDHLGEAAPLLGLPGRPRVVVKAHYNDVVRAARYAQAFYSWQRPLIDLACLRQRSRIARERSSLEQADAIVACSQWMLSALRNEGLQLPARTTVMPNPIPVVRAAEPAEEAVTPTMLLVGRIDIGKGIAHLPALLDGVVARVPNVRLEIAGGDSSARFLGSMEQWLRRRFGTRLDRVRFLGSLDTAGIEAAMRRAWVVIAPSRWDTFPTAVLEAMSLARTIVASPYGGMPEMFEGTGAPIADPASPAFVEQVSDFLFKPERRLAVGEALLNRARTVYAPGKIARDYVAWLEGVS